jgi:hypothetical protein
MSELKVIEFRERAEQAVDLPDLALIEQRGRSLRRRRVATGVGTLALAVVAGLGIAGAVSGSPDAAPVPANPAPSTPVEPDTDTWDDGVRKVPGGNGEELLLPGRSTATYDGVEVSFDVPGDQWEWAGEGAGLRISEDEPDTYATTVFWLPEPSARLGSCDTSRAQALGTDPDDLVGNVAPLLDLVSSTVLQEPRVVEAFGGRAAYLQLRTNTSCAPGGELPGQLRGMANGKRVDPGWEGPRVLDAWHVVVDRDRSVLVAAWRLDESPAQAAERRALVDSIRISAR